MTYQKFTRAQRHARYAKLKRERVWTGLGYLWYALNFLGLGWLVKRMISTSWHVADLYEGGRYVEPLHIVPIETSAQRLQRIERMARKKADRLKGAKPAHARRS